MLLSLFPNEEVKENFQKKIKVWLSHRYKIEHIILCLTHSMRGPERCQTSFKKNGQEAQIYMV
jgi:hypothetical protein